MPPLAAGRRGWVALFVVGASLSAPTLAQQGASDRDGGSASPEEQIAAHEAQAAAAEKARKGDEALNEHLRALDLARTLGRPRLVAVLFNRTGRTLEAASRIQDAVRLYEAGLMALERETGLHVTEEIKRLRQVRKEYDSASASTPPDLYSEDFVLDLEQAERDPALVVKLLVNIGNAYARQPQDGPALNAYQRALQRPEIKAFPALRAHALANSGEILWRQGRTGQAQVKLGEASRLMSKHGDQVERRRVLTLLAGIERDQKKFQSALAKYRAALDLYARVDDPLGEGRAWAGLGRLQLMWRHFDDARQAYERAVARATLTGNTELLWNAYWGLGRARRSGGDLDGAAEALQKAFERIHVWRGQLATDEGKVAFLDGARDVADQLIEVHVARARKDSRAWAEALNVVEEARGRALVDLMAGADRSAPDIAGAPEALKCSPLGPPGFPNGYAHLISRSPAEGSLANSMGDSNPVFSVRQMAAGTPSTTRSASQDAGGVGSDSAASDDAGTPAPVQLPRLVFHVLTARTVVFAVSAGGEVRAHAAKVGRAALGKRVVSLRRALRVDRDGRGMELLDAADDGPATSATGTDTLLRELHRDLVEPLADALPADGMALVIEPHEVLWLVPFAALRLADGRSLADRWPILHAPSAAVLDAVRAMPRTCAPPNLQALIVGNPLTTPVSVRWRGLEATFSPLRGAESEARAIAALFPEAHRRVLLGEDADLETVLSDLHRQGVVHLATHGVAFAADPLDSFVLLGRSRCGQLLAAREATKLRLRADLVVLSACQTGLGRITGDGIIGLARAFMVAGARTVVVSQWSVDDASTKELMVEFYEQYLKPGTDKATALQRAMQKVRSEPGREAPRYWAPFMVIGAES